MLEHADRDDAVELPVDVPIIDQFELHPVGDPASSARCRATFNCSRGQGDAEHVDLGNPVEIKRGPAPAAADVEHLLPRLQIELGGDMRLLVGLRLLQAVPGIGVVSAAILPVGVEEGR